MIIKVDKGKENYSQRNNKFTWSHNYAKVNSNTTCNVTSIVAALDYLGVPFTEEMMRGYTQPEDALADFIMNSEEVMKYYAKMFPSMYKEFIEGNKNCYTPNEVHKVLAFATNLWVGYNVITEQEDVAISEVLNDLFDNRPVVISGKFKYVDEYGFNRSIGHVVTLVGVELNTDRNIERWIIDDPYGDFHKGYKEGVSGNDVSLTKEEFVNIFKGSSDHKIRVCHRFMIKR